MLLSLPLFKHTHVKTVVVLSFLFSFISLEAKSKHDFSILNLNIENGLPSEGVTSIIEDRRGYIWIGTYDGLAKYSGNTLIKYSNSIHHKTFCSNRIRTLFEDSNGNIWIGTDIGVTLFNYDTNEFTNLEYNNNNYQEKDYIVRCIIESQNKETLYCLTEKNGVLLYDKEGNLKSQIKLSDNSTFHDFIHIVDETYLFSSSTNLLLYDFKTGEKSIVSNSEYRHTGFSTLLWLDKSSLLLGRNNGIRIINYTKENGKINLKLEKQILYPGLPIRDISIDSDSTLWIATNLNGIQLVENANTQIGKKAIQLTENLRTSTVLCLSSGRTWVGKFDNGATCYQNFKSSFNTLDFDDKANKNTRSVNTFPYDDNHIIYQYAAGSWAMFNTKSGKEVAPPFNISQSKLSHMSYSFRRNNGDIWMLMSNWQETWWEYIKKGSNKSVRVKNSLIKGEKPLFAFCACEDIFGNIWLGSTENLYRIVVDKPDSISKIESIHSNIAFKEDGSIFNRILTIYSDPTTNSLWLGSNTKGLYRVRLDKNENIENLKFENFCVDNTSKHSISSNFITSITRTTQGTLWIGTEQGGICEVDENSETLKFKAYDTKNGLANNNIKSIVADKNSNLWISTNFGISKYDATNQKFLTYRKELGVPYNEFLYPAFSNNGDIFFSYHNNICYFNPDSIINDIAMPNIEFTHLKIFNNVVNPKESLNYREIIKNKLQDNDTIYLNHSENVISIGFDAIFPDKKFDANIKYRLLPLSTKWIELQPEASEISLSGLAPRDYTLEISSSNFIGNNSNTNKIYISIDPPFSRSAKAFILYIIFLVSSVLIIMKAWMNVQKLRYKLQMEEQAKNNLELINEEKLRYFSNISHELKTPLTLIMAPLALLSERFAYDISVKDKLSSISRQSKKMLRLINLAHSIQLNDANLLKRDDSEFSFNHFIDDIIADFTIMAGHDSKDLIIDSPENEIQLLADREMIEKVINNLLTNAFKHTRVGDNIKLKYFAEDNMLHLTVEDSGFGISKQDIGNIFERFYKATSKNSVNAGGTGIGLYFSKTIVDLHNGEIKVESEEGKWTRFTVAMPIVVSNSISDTSSSDQSHEPSIVLGEKSLEEIKIDSEFKNSMIYIVEDNSDMRLELVSIISKFFHVKTFINGAECSEAMNKEWPDLVISDVMMPIMNGYQLCESIKGNIKTSHIPIILLTACSTIDDRIKGLKYGADSYIEKPFYPNHIITRIESLLSNRKKLRERFQINIPIVYGSNENVRAKDNDFLEKLYNIFSENLDNEELDIDNIVAEFGISRNLFFQKIKAITNDSPYELLKNYRLKRAAEFLQMQDANVNQVCAMVGFKSRSHFSKLFKEKYNCTPSKYGKQTLEQ